MGIGMAVGLVALALSPVFAGLLFAVSPVGPSTFSEAVSLLLLIAISAHIPSIVATRIDPTFASRRVIPSQ